MTAISLREYVQKIENLIENNDIEQSIAHCKYLLKMYPKHVDSYRLLGKSFLEKQKFSDASDIFQRVLSSIPDDFISHIGMSIIREDENNLDASIWHMERAFEVQPSNKAVQDELRRLYTKRDGVAPPKIRLTRGALVRMYMRGELYDQAIGEINSALSEDPNRIDLEVILAKIYFNLGQKVEATETCSKIITKLPYCFEANKILTEILPGTTREEDEKIFRQRVVDLDPYYEFTNDELRDSSEIPDSKIMVDYLDWDPLSDVYDQPDWAKSIGLSVDDDNPLENEISFWINNQENEPVQPIKDEESFDPQPTADSDNIEDNELEIKEEGEEVESEDMLSDKTQESPDGDSILTDEAILESSDERQPTPEELPLSSDESQSVSDDLPEWLRDAGWEKSTGEEKEAENEFSIPPLSNEETQENLEIEPGEIPDWIKEIAPSDELLDGKSIQENEEIELQNIDDLISKFEAIEETDHADKTLSSWKSEFEEESPFSKSQNEDENDISEITDKLSSLPFIESDDKEKIFEQKQELEENLDWLQNLSQEGFDNEKDPKLEETEKDFDLSSLTEKLSEDKLPENLDDGDDWLDNLVVKQSDEEAIGKTEELSIGESEENIPDWIRSVIEAEPEKIEELKTGTVDPTISMEEVPMEPKDEFTISFDESDDIPEQPEISDTDNIVDLEKAFDGSDEVLEQQTTNLEKTTSDQAISIEDGTSDELEELFAKQSLSQLEEELLATNKEISGLREDFEFSDVESESEEPVSADEKEDIESTIAWMEGMLSTQTSQSKEVEGIETEPAESAEAQPQWISDLSQESQNEPGEMDTTPSWLKELEIEAESFTEKSLELESINDEEDLIESNVADHPSKDTLFEEIDESSEQVELEEVETETFREGEMEPELVSSTEKLEGNFEETSPEIRQVAEPEDVVSEISEEFSTDIDQISIKTESLEEAKRLLDSGAVDQSIQKFDELIKDNLFLEEIISNVQNALDHHYPINIDLWKTLGDAHLKNKQLQKALDAYSKAEDLLS